VLSGVKGVTLDIVLENMAVLDRVKLQTLQKVNIKMARWRNPHW
jgi:hypothetical protein